ncbi:MAG TPA: molybdopterin-dependent oxidoreductase, partial [Desulfuromonadaceae bacterium]
QLGAMTAAGAALAGCRSQNEKLIPYLVPPDEGVTPGEAIFYASSCRSCPAGCGIFVRVSEGRAKKIEGNPAHPVNRGKLCPLGQAALQELYHPDRLARPLKRTGPRGKGEFKPVSWDEGLQLLITGLNTLKRENAADGLAMLTPVQRGTLADLTGAFMRSFGSPHHVTFDLLGPDWLRAANRKSFGQASLPFYDMASTRYLLSFGADFVDGHLSPVQYGYAFGRMRQERDTVRGHFTYVGGRLSLTAASADRWMPARPGSEGTLALGMSRLILDESLFDGESLALHGMRPELLGRHLAPYDLPRIAKETGLDRHVIAEVAREFATTRPALAMAGEAAAFQSNGSEVVRAVQLLNVLAGNLQKPGGIYPDSGAPTGPETSLADFLFLVENMRKDRIRMALIQGDPVHSVPAATGFREALARVPFIVSFSSLLDDTALFADLVLPDATPLESWGDVVPLAGTRQTVIGLMQPVVSPFCDTRQFPDVLLAAAAGVGGEAAAALPYRDYPELVKDSVKRRLGHNGGDDFERVWVDLLRKGGFFGDKPEMGKGYRWANGAPFPDPAPPRFAGDAKRFPLHLLVYPSTAFGDGRGAPLPWLQQLPDPMTTVVWDSWVEINPRTAAELGINHGDLVEVTSPQGALRLPAVIFPGIRPDTVAIPMGQGHKGAGRYARGRGANPLDLVALITDGANPVTALNGMRVRVTRVSEKGDLVTTGNQQGSFRSELIEI